MFTFLRRIRKSLIESGSARKYFFYAIGEITLVVIGILIAIQINNWNDHRKARAEEIKILSALKEDLIKNEENLQNTIDRQREANDKRKELVYIFEEYEAAQDKASIVIHYQDSIGELFMLGAYAFFREELVSGTYDAIIGSGKISLIQNQELVKTLAEYAAEILAGFEDQTSQMNFLSLVIEKSSPYLQAFWPWFNKDWSRFFFTDEKIKLEALHGFLSESSIEGVLLPMSFGETNRLRRQKMLLERTQYLLAMIEQELPEL